MPTGEYSAINFVSSIANEDVERLLGLVTKDDYDPDLEGNVFGEVLLRNLSNKVGLDPIASSGLFIPTRIAIPTVEIDEGLDVLRRFKFNKFDMIGNLEVPGIGSGSGTEVTVSQNRHRSLTYYSVVGQCSLILFSSEES